MNWYVTNKRRGCKKPGVYCKESIISSCSSTFAITTISAGSISCDSGVSVTDKLDELEKKIKDLEARVKSLESGQTLP